MKKFVIERKIEGVGRMNDRELSGAAATSNKALAQLAPKVQWVHSYVAADRTFCIYLAEEESQVHEHARISGFPATRVFEVLTMIDPTTAMRPEGQVPSRFRAPGSSHLRELLAALSAFRTCVAFGDRCHVSFANTVWKDHGRRDDPLR